MTRRGVIRLSEVVKRLALEFLPDNILLCAKKFHYASVLRRITEEEEPDLRVVKCLVQPGDCVVDIGANFGVYTKFLSGYVAPNGRVLSIEPVQSTFELLQSNVRKLSLKNVELRNLAASDADGESVMYVPKFASGGDNFYEAHIGRGNDDTCSRRFTVPTTTVDALLSTVPSVRFIKCDVEGHEMKCILGAVNTIERFKPAWQIEISGDMSEEHSNANSVFRFLCANGYEAYWLDGTELRFWEPGTRSVNYFFLSSSHVETLRRKNAGGAIGLGLPASVRA